MFNKPCLKQASLKCSQVPEENYHVWDQKTFGVFPQIQLKTFALGHTLAQRWIFHFCPQSPYKRRFRRYKICLQAKILILFCDSYPWMNRRSRLLAKRCGKILFKCNICGKYVASATALTKHTAIVVLYFFFPGFMLSDHHQQKRSNSWQSLKFVIVHR